MRETIGLEATDSLAEAGQKVLSFHFGRMLSHEPGTRQGEDIEALHDMRVATRRMRAYLEGKQYRRFKKDLLKFVSTTGAGAKPTSEDKPYQLRYLVPGLIYERFEAVHAYETRLESATPDILHQLRITDTKLEERQRLLETFPQAWAQFNHPDLRRNLALAIAVL